jgi:hypothetical protein
VSAAEARRAEADDELHRVTEFVRAGMRAGRISDESGELLIDAAEAEHARKVEQLNVPR